MNITNIADLMNPATGKTYREENNARTHKYAIGSLVEIKHEPIPDGFIDNPDFHIMDGIRLHIIAQTRDCDGEPLYSLGIKNSTGDLMVTFFENGKYRCGYGFHGYGEESLILIKEP